jgi:uncharacterized protein YbgA (DUF1722 family)
MPCWTPGFLVHSGIIERVRRLGPLAVERSHHVGEDAIVKRYKETLPRVLSA